MTSELIDLLNDVRFRLENIGSSKETDDNLVDRIISAVGNMRAVPDVPELVRYAHEYDREDGSSFWSVDDSDRAPDGEFVLHSQAVAVIAAKDAEIKIWSLNSKGWAENYNSALERAEAAEAKNTELEAAWLNAEGKISDLEHKLAQYEAQEPIGYIYTTPSYDAGGGTRFTPRKPSDGNEEWYGNLRAVYITPAPDLRAENERLREALRDVTEHLKPHVNVGAKTREPHETALSAYDRAQALLSKEVSN